MKEMTSAEFAKANLAGLTEPVSVRRYNKTIGVYYPDGFAPSEAPQLSIEEVETKTAMRERIGDLEGEVQRLKRELATRSVAEPVTIPEKRTVRAVRTDDPFLGLAKQDREFFERKLGKKK